MPSILDYSNEPFFNIKAVSQKTEIQAVTIRAWERRYNLLTPHRGVNGYRLYSERDVATLSWVKSQLESGYSISSVAAEFKEAVAQNKWPEAILTDKGPIARRRLTEINNEVIVSRLTQSLVRHDERMAAEIFAEALGSFSLSQLFELILVPVLVEIGSRWERGEIRVATEHFSSGFIRAKIMAILQSLPLHPSAPKIIVGCGPDELHEIGPIMMATLLRNAGYRVEYLGPDIPLDDLATYVGDITPRMVILSATITDSAVDLVKFPDKLQKLKQPPLFGYGGAAFSIDPNLIEQIKGTYLGKSLTQSVDTVKQMVPLRSILKN